MSDRDTAFAEYFAARSDAMRGTAYLLCGDWHRAEDLVQTTFTKLYLAWKRIDRHDALDAYTRQTLVRTFVSELRRGWFRKERVSAAAPEVAEAGPGSAEDRLVLLSALARVAPRQRAVLVLRYWEDLSIEETAKALNCSEGTVKSQAARGLRTLRGLIAPQPQEEKVR
ncbi:SigE family RNA polymerase sigma factor [Saccharothrix algeriensis]|uniref:RNA polymerase sigma-70 factor (Sigma-E family) n=1 Tax=Saccharothrix algeriensis TaxID=173560 RepID=A0A8T8HUU1_9PSEU|nr:SigE family RNA polymerase sigma factor [Saccharothrix algeriensis]MBM7813681.1 RNA polymerase sigma-70 factor (sigma-E family) [Saccharothrix algeriensis]QTR02151.1 SigE family RNA polymerase sigma factor [Saccharothrix algeriensis]